SEGVAVQCGCRPHAAARRWYAVIVEALCNVTRRPSGKVLVVDAADDHSLILDHLEFSSITRLGSVSIGTTSRMSSILDDSLHTATHLVLQVFEKKSADQATDADLRLVCLTFMNCKDVDIDEVEALVNS